MEVLVLGEVRSRLGKYRFIRVQITWERQGRILGGFGPPVPRVTKGAPKKGKEKKRKEKRGKGREKERKGTKGER